MADYSLDFVSVGCNRNSTSISWGKNNLIAFAGGHFIGLYDAEAVKLLETIPAHSDRVNAVQWVPRCDIAAAERWNAAETEIISASVDKKIKLWSKVESKAGNSTHKWVATATLEGHKDTVTALATLVMGDGSLLVASTSADNTVMLWKRTAGQHQFQPLQTITFAPKIIEAVSLTLFPGTDVPLLAAAGVDMMVHLFAAPAGDKFVRAASLQGHEDWIRFVKFVETDSGDVLLASASQDKRIRLWRVAPVKTEDGAEAKLDPAALLAKLNMSEDGNFSMSHAHVINLGQAHGRFTVMLESVMLGHEEWVNSICWAPPMPSADDPKKKTQPMRLLSASMDRTAVVWEPDAQTGIWIEQIRVGEVGGNQLGFFGSQFGPEGKEIFVNGWNGAFHLWRYSGDEDGDWKPLIPISGHFDEARDVDWNADGEYFVSVSKDQTARLFSRWLKDGQWHEIARPQVHGYDMSCLVMQPSVKHRLISGAEEKVIRVFDAPRAFVESLANISSGVAATEADLAGRATTANVPPLGLTNKPVFENKTTDSTATEDTLAEAHPQLALLMAAEDGEDGEEGLGSDSVGPRAPLLLSSPPLEEQLMQRTLWPEVHKLYGHGNELVCVCANHRGDLIASACSAKTPDQAVVRVWDTKTMKQIGELPGHKLTVIQIEFSHNDKYLVSVSRDLGHFVYEIMQDEKTGAYSFKTVAKIPKAHTRISWGCTWSPDDKYFATSCRDGVIKVWKFDPTAASADQQVTVAWKVTCDDSVTAVAFAPLPDKSNYYLLAAGQENGAIKFFTAQKSASGTLDFQPYGEIDSRHAHALTVRRIRWRPAQSVNTVDGKSTMHFATASTDRSVRLFSLDITKLL